MKSNHAKKNVVYATIEVLHEKIKNEREIYTNGR